MQIITPLKNLLNTSGLSFEEVRAFSSGIQNLGTEDQIMLYRIWNSDANLIYPSYVQFKAKLAMKKEGKDWEKAVSDEIKELERYLDNKKVGGEVK